MGSRPIGGPSGRLGGWAIAGIPAEVCDVHSKRSAQITAAVGADASVRGPSVAARATRDRKADEPLQDLMFRWQAELTALGYPPAALRGASRPPGPPTGRRPSTWTSWPASCSARAGAWRRRRPSPAAT